jgi:hypothetical protein
MAFSKKLMGKEVGQAEVYAPPHSKPYAETKTSGIKMRGAGAATKGFMCRGPMA